MPVLRLLFAGLVTAVVVVGGLIAACALFLFALLARLFGGRATVRVQRGGGMPPRPSSRAAREPDAIDVESTVVTDEPPSRQLP